VKAATHGAVPYRAVPRWIRSERTYCSQFTPPDTTHRRLWRCEQDVVLNACLLLHLTDDCQLKLSPIVSEAHLHRLRSSNSLTCAVRRTTNHLRQRSVFCCCWATRLEFSVDCSLLRQCDSLKQFKRQLKTFFSGYGTITLYDFCQIALFRNTITYLLTPVNCRRFSSQHAARRDSTARRAA